MKQGKTAMLREFVAGLLADVAVPCFYKTVPRGASPYYIVWELRQVGGLADDSRNAKRYVLEVNAYHPSSLRVLDDVLDWLESELDGGVFTEADFFLNMYSMNDRIDIEESADCKRKRIQFELKYFTREC